MNMPFSTMLNTSKRHLHNDISGKKLANKNNCKNKLSFLMPFLFFIFTIAGHFPLIGRKEGHGTFEKFKVSFYRLNLNRHWSNR